MSYFFVNNWYKGFRYFKYVVIVYVVEVCNRYGGNEVNCLGKWVLVENIVGCSLFSGFWGFIFYVKWWCLVVIYLFNYGLI